jgi:hypothetical protein
MNIVIRIDVEEATEPVHVLVKSTSELVQFSAKRTSNEPELLVQNGVPSTSTSNTSTNLEPSTSNPSTTSTLTPRWRIENNGKCTSTNCLRPLYSKTLCQACYRLSKRASYTPSEDALACVAEWVEVVKSKPSKQQQRAWAKTFDEMARIDKLSWDDIAAINRYAFENWVPQGFIQSPTKYRRRSRTYPEQWTWEVIRGHMQNGSNQRSSQANSDPLQGIDLS